MSDRVDLKFRIAVDGEGDPGKETFLNGVSNQGVFHDGRPGRVPELLLEDKVLIVGGELLLVGVIWW